MEAYTKINFIELDYKTKKLRVKDTGIFVEKQETVMINDSFGQVSLQFKKDFPKNIERVYQVITNFDGKDVIVKQHYKPNKTKTEKWKLVRAISETYCRL
jgi:hypothetical protein